MEVDLVVALELQPIELEVASSIRIFYNVANGFSETKGTAPILAFVPAKVRPFLVKQLGRCFPT